MFDGNHDRNILKVISDNNLVDIYQVKGVQVFNKKVSFSSLNNTIVNLLFVVDKPSIIEISKVDDDLKKIQELYSFKNIFDLNNKYLIVLPIYIEQQLVGGMFIFTNYQLLWQIEEHKINKFINDLEEAKCNDIIEEINNITDSLYWSLINKGVYISDGLSKILKVENYQGAFNFNGHSLLTH